MPRWSVQLFVSSHRSLIRNRLQYLGTVEADTKKLALAAAIKQFKIEQARQNKIIVNKTSKRD